MIFLKWQLFERLVASWEATGKGLIVTIGYRCRLCFMRVNVWWMCGCESCESDQSKIREVEFLTHAKCDYQNLAG